MKFIIATLFAVAAAQDAEPAKEVKILAQDEVCETAGARLGKCKEKLCCGLASEDPEQALGDTLKETRVCNEENASDWIDPSDDEVFYNFKCLPDSAQRLAISTIALLSATYMMA